MTTEAKNHHLLQEYFENAAILANLKASYFSFTTLDDQIAEIERQMRSARKARKMTRTRLNPRRPQFAAAL